MKTALTIAGVSLAAVAGLTLAGFGIAHLALWVLVTYYASTGT